MKRQYHVRAMNWVAPRDEELGRDTPPKGGIAIPQVFEPEQEHVETGVLDANGFMIMRRDVRVIGFIELG